jgi:hypothetical protein
MIIALAGRRIDAAGAETPRFPSENIELVRGRLRDLFERNEAKALVSSAACGADLLALQEAETLGMRRRVVLPFDRRRFRETSVVDRPGDWGNLYDRIVDQVEATGDLVILSLGSDDANAFNAANGAILDEAMALWRELKLQTIGVLVWDGSPRGEEDLTRSFGDEARARGFSVIEIKTL